MCKRYISGIYGEGGKRQEEAEEKAFTSNSSTVVREKSAWSSTRARIARLAAFCAQR